MHSLIVILFTTFELVAFHVCTGLLMLTVSYFVIDGTGQPTETKSSKPSPLRKDVCPFGLEQGSANGGSSACRSLSGIRLQRPGRRPQETSRRPRNGQPPFRTCENTEWHGRRHLPTGKAMGGSCSVPSTASSAGAGWTWWEVWPHHYLTGQID